MGTVHTDLKSFDAGADICETSIYVPYKPYRDSPHFSSLWLFDLKFSRKCYIIAVKFKNPDKIPEFINGMIECHSN